MLTNQLHDHLRLSKYLYEPLAESRGILSHPSQQSPDCHICCQYRCFMAWINPCCHLSLVDHLHYCIHLLFVFINMHGRLEHSHCSQVSTSLILDIHILIIVQILCLVPIGCFRMLESDLILNCEHHGQRRLGGASTHFGMLTFVHPKTNIIYIYNNRNEFTGLYDDIRLFIQHLGPPSSLPNSRSGRCSEMAKRMAGDLCLLFSFMGWFRDLYYHL